MSAKESSLPAEESLSSGGIQAVPAETWRRRLIALGLVVMVAIVWLFYALFSGTKFYPPILEPVDLTREMARAEKFYLDGRHEASAAIVSALAGKAESTADAVSPENGQALLALGEELRLLASDVRDGDLEGQDRFETVYESARETLMEIYEVEGLIDPQEKE